MVNFNSQDFADLLFKGETGERIEKAKQTFLAKHKEICQKTSFPGTQIGPLAYQTKHAQDFHKGIVLSQKQDTSNWRQPVEIYEHLGASVGTALIVLEHPAKTLRDVHRSSYIGDIGEKDWEKAFKWLKLALVKQGSVIMKHTDSTDPAMMSAGGAARHLVDELERIIDEAIMNGPDRNLNAKWTVDAKHFLERALYTVETTDWSDHHDNPRMTD